MTTPKKTVKSSRAAKAEFDRVITALEKENEVFHTSPDQCKFNAYVHEIPAL